VTNAAATAQSAISVDYDLLEEIDESVCAKLELLVGLDLEADC
jgi:hypothetical protein